MSGTATARTPRRSTSSQDVIRTGDFPSTAPAAARQKACGACPPALSTRLTAACKVRRGPAYNGVDAVAAPPPHSPRQTLIAMIHAKGERRRPIAVTTLILIDDHRPSAHKAVPSGSVAMTRAILVAAVVLHTPGLQLRAAEAQCGAGRWPQITSSP